MQLSLLKRNVAANFAGRGFVAAISVVVIPIYIRFLGIEAYGIIGFFTTLTALSALFDVGLSTTANRELARLTARGDRGQDARDLVRTLEVAYWLCAALLGVLAALSADAIATNWLQVERLGADEAGRAVRVMALVLVIQFPMHLYAGCLLGLQRHVLLNAVQTAATAAQIVGAVLVLWLVSPSLTAFFVWQGVARAVQVGLLALLVLRSLPQAPRPGRFRMGQLRRIWRFAAGMSAISVLGLLLTQVDSLLLSRLLPLSQFGYYALARSLAQGLFIFVTPVFTAVFPHFAQLAALGDEVRLRETYHRASQVLSVAVMPAAVVLALFAPHVLWAWTGDGETVRNAALLVGLLAPATALNGIQHAPYALQLASGWTKFALWANVLALAFLVPSIVYLTETFGPAGAAVAWLAMNAGSLLIAPPLMHRHLLKGALPRWYAHDCGRPLLAALAVAAGARWLFPPIEDRLLTLFVLALVYCAAAVAAAALLPWMRSLATATLAFAVRRHVP
ncbi:MAG: lipopolysaccharide biosynthesis protein [Kiloniellaceae bacterium]